MDSDRRVALSAGALFIIATAASIAGTAVSRPVLDDAGHLVSFSSGAGQTAASALLTFVAAGASAGIAIALYPVLRRWGAGLAIGSVAFRTIEGVMYVVGGVVLVSLASTLSRQPTGAGSDLRAFQAVADLLLAVRDAATVAGVLAFSAGALMYYWLFFRSRLVPRWLSVWGIAAIILMIAACLLAIFSQQPVTSYVLLALPIAVQEMVLAVWLIAKGFRSSEIRRAPLSSSARRSDGRPKAEGVVS